MTQIEQIRRQSVLCFHISWAEILFSCGTQFPEICRGVGEGERIGSTANGLGSMTVRLLPFKSTPLGLQRYALVNPVCAVHVHGLSFLNHF